MANNPHSEGEKCSDFDYLCERAWEELESTDLPNIRYCDNCQEQVHKVEDRNMLAMYANQGKCCHLVTKEIVLLGYPKSTAGSEKSQGDAKTEAFDIPAFLKKKKQ